MIKGENGYDAPFVISKWFCLFLPLLFIFYPAQKSHATELILKFKDKNGQSVKISKAELLLVAWGDTKKIELGGETDKLNIPMDETWLRPQWSGRFADMDAVYLFIKADGYASIRSERFLWIGSHGPPFGPLVTETEVPFPDGKKIVLKKGQTVEAELIFRRPQKRYLRFIDDHGKPVADVKVKSSMFWSASNHCGHLSGAEPLGDEVSDAEGRLLVPDGDFEYVFEFEKEHYILKNTEMSSPTIYMRMITYLKETETTIQMHELRNRPIKMRVTKNKKPVEGMVLLSQLSACPCGTCSGSVAVRWNPNTLKQDTDKDGMIFIPEFYPEEFEYVFFSENDKTVWKADPKKWPTAGLIEVELGEGTLSP